MGPHYILCVHTTNNKKKCIPYSLPASSQYKQKGQVGFKANPYPYTLGQLAN